MALLDAVQYARPVSTPSAPSGAPGGVGGASLLEGVKYARQEITPTPTPTITPSVNIFQQIGALPVLKLAGNFIDRLFKFPDVVIQKAQDFLAKPEHAKITEPLAFVQAKVIEPIFEKAPPLRGIQRGITQTYLGSSQNVAEVFTKPVDQPVTLPDKTLYTSGEIIGTVLSFIAGGHILKGLQLGKATLPVLFATLGQTSASTDTTVTQRIMKAPVDAFAGFLLNYVPVSRQLLSKATLKGAGVTASVLSGSAFVDSLIEGLSPEEAAKSAAKMAVIGGLFHIAGTATGLLGEKLTRSQLRTGEAIVTPQEARNRVIGTNLEGTKLGDFILKTAFEAETQGKNLKISGFAQKRSAVARGLNLKTPEGIWVGVDLVEPALAIKAEEKAIVPAKPLVEKPAVKPLAVKPEVPKVPVTKVAEPTTASEVVKQQLDKGGTIVKSLPEEARQVTPLYELVDTYRTTKPDGTLEYYIKHDEQIIKLAPIARPPVEKPKGVKVEPKGVEVEIPKELEPLAKEARKYKSADDFYNAINQASDKKLKELGFSPRIGGVDRPKGLGELYDFYTQATKGVKEVPPAKPIPKPRVAPAKRVFKLTYPEVKKLPKAKITELALKQRVEMGRFMERVEKGKISRGDLYRAGIMIRPTDLKNILKDSPEFKANPVLVYRKDKGLVFEGKKHKFNIFPEALGIKSTELKEGDIVGLADFEYKGLVPVLDKLYTEGVERTRRNPPIPRMGLSIEAVHSQTKKQTEFPPTQKAIGGHLTDFQKTIGEIIKPLRFYPDVPLEFKNAVRTDVIGGLSKARDKIYNQVNTALWGGLNQKEIGESVELIYARDQLSRAKLGKGDPRVSVEEAQKLVARLEKEISPAGKEATERYRAIQKEYTQKLIDRGLLDPENVIDDYVRHFVTDYTPDWVFNKGIPSRLRRPFRGYLKKAVGTRKEIRQDSEAILGQFLSVEYDNMIEDFIIKQAGKYDLTPKLSDTERARYFGKDKAGRIKSHAKPGRIYTIKGERYRAYSPDVPFSRQLFPTDEGLMALGRYKKTYLVPENIFNAFRDFSERGNFPMYIANKVTGFWKTAAIMSRFPSFNINNMIGDTWFMLLQSPEPLKSFREVPLALNYLSSKPEKLNAYQKRLDKFVKDEAILEGLLTETEMYRIRGMPNPIRYVLDKARNFSQFRESILRATYASYLLKGQEAGRGSQLVKFHNWIETEGLPETEALGKIARDIEFDYGWTSKTFNRYVRGLGMPFSTWYFKASEAAHKFTFRHIGKALLAFLILPILTTLANNRDEKIRKLEQKLSDNVRDRIHLIFGENPDGTIRAWYPQTPQDVLIGTKYWSIAVNQANMVINKEKTIKEAAIDTLKRWGVRELRGINLMAHPMARWIQGLINEKDPYDKTSIYPIDKSRLPTTTRIYYDFLYLLKCSAPPLAELIKSEVMGIPIDLAKKQILDVWVGKGMIGIYDFTPKAQIIYEGKVYDWDDYSKIQDASNRNMLILAKIENDWIYSGLMPEEFIKTKEFEQSMLKIKENLVKLNPEAEKLSITEIAMSEEFYDRLANSLGEDITSAQRWVNVQLERAKTEEEKRKWREKYEELRQMKLIDSLKRLPKLERGVYLEAK